MKKLIYVLPLMIISMMPAFADTNTLKIKTVKNMYNTAVKASANGQDVDTLDSLFKYSDRDLQNAVALSRISRMSDDNMELTECHNAYETLIINPSNGFAIDEAQNISYKVLSNGRVRASVKYTSEYTGIKDFSLKCNGSSCKVTDVLNSEGDSGRQGAEKLCR